MTATVVLLASVPVLFLILQTSVAEVFDSYTGLVWRRQNHPGYYSLGVMSCGLILIALSWLFPPGKAASPWLERFLLYGRSSLTAFTSGNVMLIFLEGHVTPLAPVTLAGAIALLLIAVWLVLWVKQEARDRRALAG